MIRTPFSPIDLPVFGRNAGSTILSPAIRIVSVGSVFLAEQSVSCSWRLHVHRYVPSLHVWILLGIPDVQRYFVAIFGRLENVPP